MTSSSVALTGSIVALVTPMHEDGSVDYPALRKLIDWHIAEGTDCIGVVGTTGESPTVTVEEHCEIIRVAVEQGVELPCTLLVEQRTDDIDQPPTWPKQRGGDVEDIAFGVRGLRFRDQETFASLCDCGLRRDQACGQSRQRDRRAAIKQNLPLIGGHTHQPRQ